MAYGFISSRHRWACSRRPRFFFWPVNPKVRIAQSCITTMTSAASSATRTGPTSAGRTTEGQPSTNTFEISLLLPPVVVLRRGVDQLGRLAGLLRQRRVSILVEDLLID